MALQLHEGDTAFLVLNSKGEVVVDCVREDGPLSSSDSEGEELEIHSLGGTTISLPHAQLRENVQA